jgi:hypothetical protein
MICILLLFIVILVTLFNLNTGGGVVGSVGTLHIVC